MPHNGENNYHLVACHACYKMEAAETSEKSTESAWCTSYQLFYFNSAQTFSQNPFGPTIGHLSDNRPLIFFFPNLCSFPKNRDVYHFRQHVFLLRCCDVDFWHVSFFLRISLLVNLDDQMSCCGQYQIFFCLFVFLGVHFLLECHFMISVGMYSSIALRFGLLTRSFFFNN